MKWITYLLFCLIPTVGTFANDDFLDEEFDFEEMLSEDLVTVEEDYSLDDLGIDEAIPHQEMASAREVENSAPPIEMEEEGAEMVSIAVEEDQLLAAEQKIAPSMETAKKALAETSAVLQINLRQVFAGSPIIYTFLFFLSIASVSIWLYSMMTIRSIEFLPKRMVKDLRTKLVSNQFNEALDLCAREKHFFCKMLASGILARKHGLTMMVDTMKAEGKRSTVAFWQRIGLLNEIAIIAPMLGLLGTVMGMFYAFYDLNRSVESVSLLFDGLGVSVGTTVAGLIVAILSMILHSIAKYRLVKILASVENEAQTFASLIDTRAPNYLEKNT